MERGPYAFNCNNNPVVVVEGGIDVTLTPSEQLVASGTLQVYPNSEAAQAFPAAKASLQTLTPIPPNTPGAE